MPSEPSIRLLPDHVINKIAAGEVVERPASVLKEILENAVDAGADQVEVDVVGGGKRAIVVADNGRGMSREDALLSIERHATSKIRDIEDIERISTMGFRGEALAAIAAVSRFSLLTRTRDQAAGTAITVAAGRVLSVEEAGCPPGTTVAVRSLFFNVPARRKFLRTEQTEFAHLRQVVLLQALAHPGLALRLRADERPVYELPGGASLEERIRELFGVELMPSLVPVDFAGSEARITGFAGLPRTHRADRTEQYIFVNGRAASAPVIGHAVQEAYHTRVPRGRHPVLFLFIDTDPGQVDVNVHPTKREIRFRRSREIRDAVMEALGRALRPGVADPGPAATAAAAPPAPEPLVSITDLPLLDPFPYPVRPAAPAGEPRVPLPPPPALSGEDRPADPAAPWAWCRILGQAGGLYVALETDAGLVLLDPQAAHERVLFEQFMREVRARQVASQGLLVPETVELSPAASLRVRDNEPLLVKLGFGLSAFGGDSYLVDALPALLGNVSAASVLGEIATQLEQGGVRSGAERQVAEVVARAACQAAVGSTRTLSLAETQRLVTDLAAAEMPYTCPRGRPTMIFMSYRELDRKFGRGR